METANRIEENKINFTPKDFETIFSLIVQEKNTKKIYKDFLTKILNTTSSKLASILIFNGKQSLEEIYTISPQENSKSIKKIEDELKVNLPFIIKWIEVNKKAFIFDRTKESPIQNLNDIIKLEHSLFSPCSFSEKLQAIIFLGKNDEPFSQIELNTIEQFSFLIGFSITLLKSNELNQELETRLNQKQRLETIGKLSSGIAHDFNNLLSSIFASVNLLKKRADSDDKILHLINTIEECSIRARELTKGLLSFGKPTPRHNEEISPANLIEDVAKIFKQTVSQNVKFTVNIGNNIPEILGNSTQLHQVLMNLCVNAKEALNGGGAIEIAANNFLITEENQPQYPFLSKGNHLHLTVADTGCGIPEENLQNIFDPYFSTKNKETDSGIGLYVSYGIIKAHNGHIEVSSELNKGTKFEIFIPSIEKEKKYKEGKKEKIILLADDEIILQDLIAELLESYNYYVIKVQNGEDVLKILTEESMIDLLVIDYNMPVLNGIDCIAKIRKLKFNFPIILSTGSMGIIKNLDLKKMGINKLLNKPYNFENLLSTIEELI
jgi:signal transduction histidine kinase/CheY-like chemotaxis protein